MDGQMDWHSDGYIVMTQNNLIFSQQNNMDGYMDGWILLHKEICCPLTDTDWPTYVANIRRMYGHININNYRVELLLKCSIYFKVNNIPIVFLVA